MARAVARRILMRACLFAAGVGDRLIGVDGPKILLRFGGHTLLERHVRILQSCGVDRIVVATGYRAADITHELAQSVAGIPIETVHNPDYRAGSIVTQWALRAHLSAGDDVLLMDGDVLYDQRMIARLLGSRHANCFLLDRNIEPGDEPAKLCVKNGQLVDFRKQPEHAHDWHGESVGFFRLSGHMARRLADATRRYIDAGQTTDYYDEALRDLLIAEPPGAFGFEDITGLPWTEIDFPDDIDMAERCVWPQLQPLPQSPATAGNGDES